MEIDDNNPELPGKPELNLPKKGKTVAELRKELNDGVPVNSKVPSAPTNTSELSDVGDEYEKVTGLKRATLPPTTIVIGDRIMEAGKMHEMRTGTSHRGFPAIGVLYEYPGDIGLKFDEIELPEGTDPMPMAKGLKWGVAHTIAPAIVRDHPPGGFLTMVPFKPADLVNLPVLTAHKAAYDKKLDAAYGARIRGDAQKIAALNDEVLKANAAKAVAENWAADYKSDSLLIKWLKWLIGILILIGVIVYVIRH
jgi:hypothetical protein